MLPKGKCIYACYKKGTFEIFTGFGHLQTSETSGRNMIVELDSRHPLLPKTVWENEDLTLILRPGENGNFSYVTKGKIYMHHMLKRKFCVANFRFLAIIIFFVFVFFSFTPALKALVFAKRPPLQKNLGRGSPFNVSYQHCCKKT
jgi:hypothetical protein